MIPDRLAAIVSDCVAIVSDCAAIVSDHAALIVSDPLTADSTSRRVTDERATSPTVGSVLLVGITVVLATATGTHLFGLTGGSQTGFATATVDFSTDDDRVTVTWMVDADADKLMARVQVGNQSRTVELESVGDEVVVDSDGVTVNTGTVGHWETPKVSDGDRVSVTVTAVRGGERVVVADRSERV